MPTKKSANLSPSLVAVKGTATPASDAVGRQAEPLQPSSTTSSPLNFKVDADFRRRFRQRAAEADLKLNELLREALAAWEREKGVS